jgi:hypothetical protein
VGSHGDICCAVSEVTYGRDSLTVRALRGHKVSMHSLRGIIPMAASTRTRAPSRCSVCRSTEHTRPRCPEWRYQLAQEELARREAQAEQAKLAEQRKAEDQQRGARERAMLEPLLPWAWVKEDPPIALEILVPLLDDLAALCVVDWSRRGDVLRRMRLAIKRAVVAVTKDRPTWQKMVDHVWSWWLWQHHPALLSVRGEDS